MESPSRIVVWLTPAEDAEQVSGLLRRTPPRPREVVPVPDVAGLRGALRDGVADAVVVGAPLWEEARPVLQNRSSLPVLLVAPPLGEVPPLVEAGGANLRVVRTHTARCGALPALIDAVIDGHRARRELQLANEQFELSAAMLQDAGRVARVGSWVWEVDADQLWTSREFAIIRGIAADDVPTTRDGCLEGVHVEDRRRVADALQQVLDTGHSASLAYRLVLPGDVQRGARCEMQAVRDRDGRVVRIVATEQDVTEQLRAEDDRARLENQLRHSQKLEALGRLAAGAAHDFNNVLTSILGHAQLARLALSGGEAGEDQLASHLEAVESACRRATSLTRHLLTIGRREVAESEYLDVHSALTAHETMLRRLVREDIAIDMRLAATSTTVELPRDQFDQVLMNLVVNACDAMPSGGSIRVSTDDVEFAEGDPQLPPAGKPGRFVRIGVRDTGVGIGAEDLERVFEPFYTTKPRDKGTGLGLAIIQGICTQADGFVTVDSQLGAGTRFDVHLPVVEMRASASASEPAQDREPNLCGDETILFCEDEDRVRESLARLLRSRGYRVLEARDAVEAISAASQAGPIDLLIADVVLTGMSGPRLARTLLETRPSMRVLFVSGYAPDELEDADARALEEDHLLEKPFSGDDLLQRIRQLCDARTADA